MDSGAVLARDARRHGDAADAVARLLANSADATIIRQIARAQIAAALGHAIRNETVGRSEPSAGTGAGGVALPTALAP